MAESNEKKINEKIEEIKKKEEKLKSKIQNYYGKITPDQLIWNLFPNFFIYKLTDLNIISVSLKTNAEGSRIDFAYYSKNRLNFNKITPICEVFDTILKASGNERTESTSSTDCVVSVPNQEPLIKYTITTHNKTNKNLTNKNIILIKNL